VKDWTGAILAAALWIEYQLTRSGLAPLLLALLFFLAFWLSVSNVP
jgi:hypothetical protein